MALRMFSRVVRPFALPSRAFVPATRRFISDVQIPKDLEHTEFGLQTNYDVTPRSINPGPRPEEPVPTQQIDDALGSLAGFRDVTVDKILKEKEGRALISLTENDTVYSALQLMDKNGIGALIVKNESGGIAGMFSERDYLNKIVVHGLTSKNTPLRSVMTKEVHTADLNNTAGELMAMMTERRFRHVPVLGEDGSVKGLVSIGDLVKFVTGEQKTAITKLQDYIKESS
eukprot:TRINITY_DN4965_c0_g1_i7.p1 TRINITY_DN4965_c0_g1~~TRINITY_DN4965_c0_g1_i7.p1  ORF type:complete len:229 (+),score=74.08 TRINITY_DN4965_c0_g1_i7:95-781(+)